MPNDVSCPLVLSPALGDFKNCYPGEVVGFYSLGQKQYNIQYVKEGILYSDCKISGLSLKTYFNENQMHENTFEIFIDSFIQGKNMKQTFQQQKNHSDFVNLKVFKQLHKFTFSNQLLSKRIVNVFDSRLQTYPYGFNFGQ
ncbi:MAG: hypothetical protein FJ333_08290 [Sphingomonadales bacterium]|nr:hypothetical protein [Sphingomonadales bacterium]